MKKRRLARRALWAAAFGAIAWRVGRKLTDLDKPLPEDQPAVWPPLAFEPPKD